MKREIEIVLLFSFLSLAFILITNHWEQILLFVPKHREYLLAGVLLLIQTQLLNSLQNKFMSSNHSLIDARRKLLLFYSQTQDKFYSIYQNAVADHQELSICCLLVQMGFIDLDDPTIEQGRKWIEKEERIPFNCLPTPIGPLKRIKLSFMISEFHANRTRYGDLFFDCLSGNILPGLNSQPIIEIVLIWISNFFLLVEIFEINLTEHSALIISFLAITIIDLSKHYLSYEKEVKRNLDVITQFYNRMQHMCTLMNDSDGFSADTDCSAVPASTEEKFSDIT